MVLATRGFTNKIISLLLATVLIIFSFDLLWAHRIRLLNPNDTYQTNLLESKKSPKNAYATLLVGSSGEEDVDWADDNYFLGIRTLAYQLLHHSGTRSNNIPYLVLTARNVSEAKQDRLRKDGATIIPVELIVPGFNVSEERWVNLFTKFRAWELTEYDRICLIDSDMVLSRRLDGIFNDPAVALQTIGNNLDPGAYHEDEGPLPRTYAFAGSTHTDKEHNWPPVLENDIMMPDYVNGGFLVFRPDRVLFNYYMTLMSHPDRFVTKFAEQDLLNYAHRPTGNMPWKQIGKIWTATFPKLADVEGGLVAAHEKFWNPYHQDIGPYLQSWRFRMEGYFEAMERIK